MVSVIASDYALRPFTVADLSNYMEHMMRFGTVTDNVTAFLTVKTDRTTVLLSVALSGNPPPSSVEGSVCPL